MPRPQPVQLEDRRELFTDDLLIDALKRCDLHQHEPRQREIVMAFDKPWEGPISGSFTIIRDDDRFRLYYRAWGELGVPKRAYVCMAESADGITFMRPNLGLHSHRRGRRNNIILADNPAAQSFAPFLDTNPDARPSQRFKALANNAYGVTDKALCAYVSPDGIHWKMLRRKPVLFNDSPHPFAFDSHNVSFWSQAERQYVAYFRTWSDLTDPGPHTVAEAQHGLRRISRATSDDFVTWKPSTLMRCMTRGKPSPEEHLYISQTQPYFRAPHLYIALPARFMQNRRAINDDQARRIGIISDRLIPGPSEPCFMTTRPGRDWFDRTFLEPLRKPDLGPEHWSSRCNYPACGLVQTSPTEMSYYTSERYGQHDHHLRRYAVRLDGFISIRADHRGGELITRPLTFTGNHLELNYATGVAGDLRVEIQSPSGKPLKGYTLRDAVELFGNELAGRARWKHGDSVAALGGQPVRLRFVMREADLFSLRFG